jgi:MFS family permease
MLVFPIMSGFVANRAADSNRGKYMGMFTLTFAMSFVFGPATGAFIYAQFGPNTLWTGVAFVGIFILLFFRFVHAYLNKK